MDKDNQHIDDLTNDRIGRLLSRLVRGELTEKEQIEVDKWLSTNSRVRAIYDTIMDERKLQDDIAAFNQPDTEAALLRLQLQINQGSDSLHPKRSTKAIMRWIPYAAAVFIIATIFGYFFVYNTTRPSTVLPSVHVADIAPNSSRATLQLANGQAIQLDATHDGIVVGHDAITYADGSTLTNSGFGSSEDGIAQELVLSTPVGGTYQITLPDGSRAWLNSSSTLRYPSRFSENERVVFLEGEAFFDVVSTSNRTTSKKTPFKVLSNDQVIEVLGTEFNVKAYRDDRVVKTTLVEGLVRVSSLDGDQIPITLHPGQQSKKRHGRFEVYDVDIFDYTSWKDGIIVLSNATLSQVITEIENWYDVSFEPLGTNSHKTAYILINRKENLSSVLKALSKTYDITFKIEERRIKIQE